jgi:hypothetical protein
MRIKITFFICLLFCLTLHAQKESFIKRIKTNLEQRQKRKDSLIKAGRPFLSILAGPGYTPEAGLLIGGGVLYTFSTDPSNPKLQRSTIPLMGSISTKGSVGLSSVINTFWLEDKLRVRLKTKFSNIEDDYFGIGYETNSSTERGEETSGYNRTLLWVEPGFNIKVLPNLFVGASYTYNSFKVKNTNPIMRDDPNFIAFGDKINESGMTYNITYDSRDVVVNAYSGIYADVSYYKPSSNLGGNQDYEVYEADIRYYQKLNRPGNTLAFRAYGRQATGKVPYSGMTLIGSADLLRGYLNGQFRDKTGLAFIGEWRYMFLKKDGQLSKNGIATWLASGSVGENFGKLNNWMPNTGIGYRLELQPRMNLRIDFGVGKNSSGLYFNMTEAF